MTRSRKRFTPDQVAEGLEGIWQKQRSRWGREGKCPDCGCPVPWSPAHLIKCKSGLSPQQQDKELRQRYHRDYEPCCCRRCLEDPERLWDSWVGERTVEAFLEAQDGLPVEEFVRRYVATCLADWVWAEDAPSPGAIDTEAVVAGLCAKISNGDTGLTAERVRRVLEREGLADSFYAVEDDPAAPGEVVLWLLLGHRVTSVAEAVEFARGLEE